MVDAAKNLSFIFPGQGSQSVGMGRSLHDAYAVARDAFEEANDALGMDLRKLCFEGPEAGLNLTENTQPALLAASVAALRAFRAEFPAIFPAFVAGHSLGEYTALVASEVIGFSDALRLVRLRGRLMQVFAAEGTGMMSAVMGLTPEEVSEICASVSSENEKVVAANINSPEQVVISGHRAAVLMAGEEAVKKGAKRVIELPVSVPSHSPLMERAASRLDEELSRIAFGNFNVPLITNVEAEPALSPERMRGLLTRQLTSPVRWVDVIRKMRALGVSTTIEIGPGRVLSGLVRRIDRDITALNFSAPQDVAAIRGFFVLR
ncbi:MAG: ACP S-malonyltransferase [Deltaproteobacteria bacterium]|nr:ACP S-malonyltransferase [Deltaproteobacteria bacterium]